MENIDFYKVLSYGAIGLSCILAIAAYFLLTKEQDKERPRKQILNAIYVFMSFALILTILSFFRENVKDDKHIQMESIKDVNAEKLRSIRDQVRLLLDQKQVVIRQIQTPISEDSIYDYRSNNMINTRELLQSLDSAMTQIIKEEEIIK